MIKINVRNVVVGGTVGMGVPIDVLSRLGGAMYNPTEFPGVRFRLNGCTVMIFGTGKVVVVGSITGEDAFDAINMLVGKLARSNIPTGVVKHRVCNVVCTASIRASLDLGSVSRSIPRSLYEPEHFPGITMRRQNPKCTILLFASGNLVCVGADSVQNASDAVNQLYDDLCRGKQL